MTTDLWMLVFTALLNLALPLVAVIALNLKPGGLEYGLGNRDSSFALDAWGERARRAHNNMTENLAIFAVLVLVTHVSGNANATTAMGATIFFLARIAHAIVYILGIKIVRTIIFFVAIGGELMILSQLLN